ncbi:MAG TPA: DNA recombination protein RmuC [Bacteroidales bacterium]
MEIIYIVAGLLIGISLGYVIAKFARKAKVLELQQEIEKAASKGNDELNNLDKQNALLSQKIAGLEQEKQATIEKYENEARGRQEAEKKMVAMDSAFKNLEEKLETEKKQLEELQNKFKMEFENIANKILKQNTFEFNQTSNKAMSELLTPLKEKISDFEKKVNDTYEKGLKDQTDLKVELKKLYDLSIALDKDAQNLTKALKSDTKKQGNWGEVILERVLERSGLIKDQEYFLQYSAKSEEGATLRPDVLIKLPENKHLVIDSKVSLTAYTEFASAEDDLTQAAALKRHLDSIKKHVKELSEKQYDKLLDINTPDFVLMFMPIEPAFGVAVQADHELFNYAWKERVVIVSPTTLLATLRTVASIWKYEKQTQNAMDIADRGGKLYDKFESFVKDLENIGSNLERASKSYDDAHKKLTSGPGNLIRQVEQLKEMGVPTKKSLPPQYLNLNE